MAVHRALALLALLLVSTGGCTLAGRSFGEYVDDRKVKGAVKRRLSSEAGTRRGGVNVDTFGGTVYLTGIVDTERQKAEAEIAAWQVEGVEQVVNDLVVRGEIDAPAASPLPAPLHPLRQRLPGVARLAAVRQGGPELAYDAKGRVVATVYTVSMREVIDRDVETLRGEGRPIDHVEIIPLLVREELPVPHYAIVLWHVSEPDAAALR
jgi:hypothetical protein